VVETELETVEVLGLDVVVLMAEVVEAEDELVIDDEVEVGLPVILLEVDVVEDEGGIELFGREVVGSTIEEAEVVIVTITVCKLADALVATVVLCEERLVARLPLAFTVKEVVCSAELLVVEGVVDVQLVLVFEVDVGILLDIIEVELDLEVVAALVLLSVGFIILAIDVLEAIVDCKLEVMGPKVVLELVPVPRATIKTELVAMYEVEVVIVAVVTPVDERELVAKIPRSVVEPTMVAVEVVDDVGTWLEMLVVGLFVGIDMIELILVPSSTVVDSTGTSLVVTDVESSVVVASSSVVLVVEEGTDLLARV
jgi:hypothetical protein